MQWTLVQFKLSSPTSHLEPLSITPHTHKKTHKNWKLEFMLNGNLSFIYVLSLWWFQGSHFAVGVSSSRLRVHPLVSIDQIPTGTKEVWPHEVVQPQESLIRHFHIVKEMVSLGSFFFFFVFVGIIFVSSVLFCCGYG